MSRARRTPVGRRPVCGMSLGVKNSKGRNVRAFSADVRSNVEFGTVLLGIVGLMAAAAGATFVVDSAMEMGQKGSTTATEAATQQGSALKVLEVRDERGVAGLIRLRELVAPEGAASEVRLDALVIRMSLANQAFTFGYSEEARAGSFTVVPVRDEDGSLAAGKVTLNEGDLAELVLELGAAAPLLDSQGVYTQTESGAGMRTTESTFTVAGGPTGNIVRIL